MSAYFKSDTSHVTSLPSKRAQNTSVRTNDIVDEQTERLGSATEGSAADGSVSDGKLKVVV